MPADSVRITWKGWDLVAHFDFTPPRAATYWQPEEGGIDGVTELRTLKGRDVSFMLKNHDKDILELVEQAVWERRRSELADADPDYTPSYFHRSR